MCCLKDEDCLEELDDDFYDEEFEEKPSKSKKAKTSSFDTLKKHFDIVEVEEHEIYDLFICKNKIKDKVSFIEYEAWLCTKIKKGSKEGFAEDVLKYIDKLINFYKTDSTKLSLFIDAETENKGISIKDLSFWDCINDYYLFELDDYLKDIPKDNEEMMAFVKKCITLYFENPEKEYDSFDFDYDEYLTSEPISDREMLSRLYSTLRMYFGLSTYVEDRYSIYYLNGEVHKITKKGEVKKRFYASYYGARLKIELYDEESKFYDLYDKEFCSWLREKLNVPYREPLTDNEVIKDSLLDFSKRFVKDEKEFYSFINDAKDAVDFRKNIISYIKKLGNYTGHQGGGGSPLDDCYSISYEYDLNYLNLEISQLNEYRKQLNREIDSKSSREDYTYIFKVKGIEVFEKMYEYLSDILDDSTKLDSFKSTLNNLDETGYSDEQLNCFMNGFLF